MTGGAEVGDRLVVRRRALGKPARIGQILEASDPDGSPPSVVRWLDDERTSVAFPGSDAAVTATPPLRPRRTEARADADCPSPTPPRAGSDVPVRRARSPWGT